MAAELWLPTSDMSLKEGRAAQAESEEGKERKTTWYRSDSYLRYNSNTSIDFLGNLTFGI